MRRSRDATPGRNAERATAADQTSSSTAGTRGALGREFHVTSANPIPGTGPCVIASANNREIRYVRNPLFREWSHAAQPDGNPDEIVMRYGLTPAQSGACRRARTSRLDRRRHSGHAPAGGNDALPGTAPPPASRRDRLPAAQHHASAVQRPACAAAAESGDRPRGARPNVGPSGRNPDLPGASFHPASPATGAIARTRGRRERTAPGRDPPRAGQTPGRRLGNAGRADHGLGGKRRSHPRDHRRPLHRRRPVAARLPRPRSARTQQSTSTITRNWARRSS